jgi:hypothetical protein
MTKESEAIYTIRDDIKEIKENLNKIFSKINSISERSVVNSEKIRNIERDRDKIISESKQKVMIWVYGLILATGSSIILFLINFIMKG